MISKTLDVKAYEKKQAELREMFTVDDTHIVIHIPNTDAKYEISRVSCQSAEQVVSWIFQLSEKSWIDRDSLRHFIKIASKLAGISL